MDNQRMTLMRAPTAPSRAAGLTSSIGLPQDLLAKARDRVKLVALLFFLGALFGTLVDVLALGIGILFADLTSVSIWVVTGLSLLLYVTARSARFSSELVFNLALLYEIALCLIISFMIPWETQTLAVAIGAESHLTELLRGITWVTPLIIIFPLLIPCPPRKTLVVAVCAALTAPLGLIVLSWVGYMDVEPQAYVHSLFSPGIAVAIAYFGSRVVYGIGLAVSRARQMGSYQLDTRLGAGGMGEVWRASHRMLARPAAIKLIKPEMLQGTTGEPAAVVLQRFEREAQATALLRSPHTVELFDFGITDDGTFYYVMELLDGFDLESLVGEFGPVRPARAVHVLRQMCHSLGEAHANGLIHRDIKPANVYACRHGRDVDFVKVLDFGLVTARSTSDETEAKLTAAHVAGGTPAYMAPEQILGDSPVDARTDVYAMGCVAYWLLTGQLVFEGETAMKTMMHHAQSEPAPPSTRGEMRIPPALDELVLACLAKSQEERPQSMDEVTVRLAGIEPEWSMEQAREWWDTHRPETNSTGAQPVPTEASA